MRQIWDSKFIVEKRETLIQCQKSYNIWSYAAILADKICKELKQSQRLSCNMILVSLMWNCLFLRIQFKPQCCFPPSAKKKPQSLIFLFSVSLFFVMNSFSFLLSPMNAFSIELSTKHFSQIFSWTTSPFTFFPHVQILFGKPTFLDRNNTVCTKSPFSHRTDWP